MKYLIDEQTLKNLIAYLQTKPYQEVAQGIMELSKLERVEE